MSSEKTVLAIDPGTSKLGMALVQRDKEGKLSLLWRCVCPTGELETRVDQALTVTSISMAIVGNGTKSKDVVSRLRSHTPSIGILTVDERDTTMQARERYWEHHPRTGWRRLLPATLQTPPEPVDDFVALILAERVLT